MDFLTALTVFLVIIALVFIAIAIKGSKEQKTSVPASKPSLVASQDSEEKKLYSDLFGHWKEGFPASVSWNRKAALEVEPFAVADEEAYAVVGFYICLTTLGSNRAFEESEDRKFFELLIEKCGLNVHTLMMFKKHLSIVEMSEFFSTWQKFRRDASRFFGELGVEDSERWMIENLLHITSVLREEPGAFDSQDLKHCVCGIELLGEGDNWLEALQVIKVNIQSQGPVNKSQATLFEIIDAL